MTAQSLLMTLTVIMLLVALLVAGRLLGGLISALRAHRYLIASLTVVGLIIIVAAVGMVVVVWFTYAVAHIGKDAESDLFVLAITVPPFFVVSFGLWLLAGKLLAKLKS